MLHPLYITKYALSKIWRTIALGSRYDAHCACLRCERNNRAAFKTPACHHFEMHYGDSRSKQHSLRFCLATCITPRVRCTQFLHRSSTPSFDHAPHPERYAKSVPRDATPSAVLCNSERNSEQHCFANYFLRYLSYPNSFKY